MDEFHEWKTWDDFAFFMMTQMRDVKKENEVLKTEIEKLKTLKTQIYMVVAIIVVIAGILQYTIK